MKRAKGVRGRVVNDRIMMLLMILAAAICLVPLADILWIVTVRGTQHFTLATIFTPTTGIAGGLSNAIVGTLIIVFAALILATPIGVFAALFISEIAGPRFAGFIRNSAETLTGVPSIVLGYFGYVTMVVWFGWGFSLLAAAITLTIMMFPYILRSTDLAMQKVSVDLRHASFALGASRIATAFRIVLRASVPGILTGVILATGIAMGETAPLLYTAGFSNYLPSGKLFHSPVGYLTYVVWTYINEPFDSSHALAYAAALVLMVLVLCFNVVGRFVIQRTTR